LQFLLSAGATPMENTWLSNALDLNNVLQCAGPVVRLKAPGNINNSAPFSASILDNSTNLKS